VIDTGRPIVHVAREIGVGEALQGRWMALERAVLLLVRMGSGQIQPWARATLTASCRLATPSFAVAEER
jgi:hypothetical protein